MTSSDEKRPPREPRWEPRPLHAPSPEPRRPQPRRDDRSGTPAPKPGSRVVVIDLA